MKNRHRKFDLQVLPARIHVFTGDWDRVTAWVGKKDPGRTVLLHGGWDGCAFAFTSDADGILYPCIWLATRSLEVVTHEVIHLTFRIFDAVGIKKDDEELVAYYAGFLTDKVMEIIK